MTSRKMLRDKIKKYYIEELIKWLESAGEEVLRTGSNEIAFPVTDEEGNEDFVVVTVKIPVGANKRTEPYDGYAMAEDYAIRQKEKAEKAKEKEKAKKEKIKRDEEYRKNLKKE